jgi:hypothetical protein
VTARDVAGERPGEVIGRGLPDDCAAAGAGLDDAEKLERAERFADRCARHLELLGELALRRELVTGAEVALLEQTLDLLDESLIKAAAADLLDDGQGPTSPK